MGCSHGSIHNYIKDGIIPPEAIIPYKKKRFLIDRTIADPAMEKAGKPTHAGDRGKDLGFRRRQSKPYIYRDEKVVPVGTPMHPSMKKKMEAMGKELDLSIAEINRRILEVILYDSRIWKKIKKNISKD